MTNLGRAATSRIDYPESTCFHFFLARRSLTFQFCRAFKHFCARGQIQYDWPTTNPCSPPKSLRHNPSTFIDSINLHRIHTRGRRASLCSAAGCVVLQPVGSPSLPERMEANRSKTKGLEISYVLRFEGLWFTVNFGHFLSLNLLNHESCGVRGSWIAECILPSLDLGHKRRPWSFGDLLGDIYAEIRMDMFAKATT